MTVDKSTVPAVHHRWWALAAVAFGVSLIIMDATVVNVALPVVIEDLGLSSAQAEWMNAVYSLAFAALLLTLGRVGDLYGRRRLFALGMAVFVLASLAAGAAGSGTRPDRGPGRAGRRGGDDPARRPSPPSTRCSRAGIGESPSRSGVRRSAEWPPSALWSADG